MATLHVPQTYCSPFLATLVFMASPPPLPLIFLPLMCVPTAHSVRCFQINLLKAPFLLYYSVSKLGHGFPFPGAPTPFQPLLFFCTEIPLHADLSSLCPRHIKCMRIMKNFSETLGHLPHVGLKHLKCGQ